MTTLSSPSPVLEAMKISLPPRMATTVRFLPFR